MHIEHDFPFDPRNGMSQEELLKVQPPEEPAGFREFREENYRLVMSAPLNYHLDSELWCTEHFASSTKNSSRSDCS